MMDTVVSVTAYGAPEIAQEGVSRAFQAMDSVDRIASFYRQDSELSLWNSNRRIDPSASFSLLIKAASVAAQISNGSFDATFSVLHKAYGFYDGKGRFPTSEELAECLSHVGWSRMVSENYSLATGAMVDFGGIAGGFAVSEAANALRSASCPAFFIDDGGDLYMEGSKPDGNPWKVLVKDPRGEGFLASIETYGPAAISTSGDYERFVEIEGQKICHIFDTVTGKSAQFYHSVTVIASDPLSADTKSTTLFSLPPDKAVKWAEDGGIPVLFLPASGATFMSSFGKSWFKNVVQ